MFEQIKNWFSRKGSTQQTKPESPPEEPSLSIVVPAVDYISKLTFTINFQGDLVIQFNWTTVTDEEAYLYADLLHRLTSGSLTGTIAESMLSLGDGETNKEAFIRAILMNWRDMEAETQNEPIIRPSDVLKLGRDKL